MILKYLLASVLVLLSSNASAEVKHVSEHGFIIENTIETQKSADIMWHALINDVDSWWPKDHSWWYGTFSIEPEAGGCFCETNGQQSAEHMRIVFVNPGKTLRMAGGLGPLQGMGMNGALDWSITTDGDKTQVNLVYRVHGMNPEGFAELAPIVDRVQAMQLGALLVFVESGDD